MIDLINQINKIGWSVVFVSAILLLLIGIAAKELFVKALETFGQKTKSSIEKEQILTRIGNLEKEIETMKSERIHDREQSLEIQKQLTESQNNMNDSLIKITCMVNDLMQQMRDMQDKNDCKERAKLKDRISQSYRYYHKEQKWTSMDKESFTDLIHSYELAGGKNSFVHSTCEPESETWEIVDE